MLEVVLHLPRKHTAFVLCASLFRAHSPAESLQFLGALREHEFAQRFALLHRAEQGAQRLHALRALHAALSHECGIQKPLRVRNTALAELL